MGLYNYTASARLFIIGQIFPGLEMNNMLMAEVMARQIDHEVQETPVTFWSVIMTYDHD